MLHLAAVYKGIETGLYIETVKPVWRCCQMIRAESWRMFIFSLGTVLVKTMHNNSRKITFKNISSGSENQIVGKQWKAENTRTMLGKHYLWQATIFWNGHWFHSLHAANKIITGCLWNFWSKIILAWGLRALVAVSFTEEKSR